MSDIWRETACDSASCPAIVISSQLEKSEWAPDYGPATFVPSWGATVTGARKFLIAFNINLLSTKEQAHRIALDIREQGRGKDQVAWIHLLYFTMKGMISPHGIRRHRCVLGAVLLSATPKLMPFEPSPKLVPFEPFPSCLRVAVL